MADEMFGDGGDAVFGAGGGGDDLPMDGGDVGGNSAEDFAVEELDQFGATLGGPIFGGANGLAVVKDEGIGKIGPGVGFGLVPVDGMGALTVLRDAGAQSRDAEEVHHVLMVGRGGGLSGSGWSSLRCGGLGERGGESKGEKNG